MKFKWRLDRVLNIKIKEEEIKCVQAAEIASKLADARDELLAKQKKMAELLEKIKNDKPEDRLRHQQLFIESCLTDDEAIRRISDDITTLKEKQRQKLLEVVEAKSFVERLGKLRQKACEQFIIDQNKAEQKHLDENYSLRFSKKSMTGLSA